MQDVRSKGPFTADLSASTLPVSLLYSFPISLNFPETILKGVVPLSPILIYGPLEGRGRTSN